MRKSKGKYLVIFLTAAILSLFIYYFFLKKDYKVADLIKPGSSPTPAPVSPQPSTYQSLESGNKVQWITVRDSEKIFLFSNLEAKITSAEAKSSNSCLYLVSGGFYTEGGKHIGLFISDSNKISDSVDNQTFNGFYSVSRNGSTSIMNTEPASPRLALQTGPVLLKDGKALTLNIKDDENARRLVAATNRFNQTIFLVFYNANSTIQGPTLTQLPGLLSSLDKKTNLDLDDALNLDGGAHSAFISDTVTLSELSTIGSYFCIKP